MSEWGRDKKLTIIFSKVKETCPRAILEGIAARVWFGLLRCGIRVAGVAVNGGGHDRSNDGD